MVEIKAVTVEVLYNILEWIAEHKELSKDYENHFGHSIEAALEACERDIERNKRQWVEK